MNCYLDLFVMIVEHDEQGLWVSTRHVSYSPPADVSGLHVLCSTG